MISTTYVKSCFGSCHIHHGSRHVHPSVAWVLGVPGCLTIEYESGNWTRHLRPRSDPALRFWDWGKVGNMPIAKRTQGLDNLYGQRNVAGKTAKPKPGIWSASWACIEGAARFAKCGACVGRLAPALLTSVSHGSKRRDFRLPASTTNHRGLLPHRESGGPHPSAQLFSLRHGRQRRCG
jgi:hypothetical protein